jgi:hypothetical protein
LSIVSSSEFLGEIGEKGEIPAASCLVFLLLKRESENGFVAPRWTLGDDEKLFQI